MKLDVTLEALLFAHGEPLSLGTLARLAGISLEALTEALGELEQRLQGGGTRLMRANDEVMLRTAPECASAVSLLEREERSQPLGPAGFETLAIVLYRGPLSRSAIERIRGVQSSSILRTLLVRGLIERAPPSGKERSPLYQATFNALAHVGVTSLKGLPEYSAVNEKLEIFESQENNQENSTA